MKLGERLYLEKKAEILNIYLFLRYHKHKHKNVHTSEISISTRKSKCEPGRRKHKRKGELFVSGQTNKCNQSD